MFDLGKVVVGVAVQRELPEAPQREFLLWPDFGDVKD